MLGALLQCSNAQTALCCSTEMLYAWIARYKIGSSLTSWKGSPCIISVKDFLFKQGPTSFLVPIGMSKGEAANYP